MFIYPDDAIAVVTPFEATKQSYSLKVAGEQVHLTPRNSTQARSHVLCLAAAGVLPAFGALEAAGKPRYRIARSRRPNSVSR